LWDGNISLRLRSQKIVPFLGCSPVKTSVRKIAELVKISKSSVHRIVTAFKKRNRHAESYFWETVEGDAWLRLLAYGTIFHFGIRSGVSAEMLSEFFKLLHLDKHIGVSPSSIKKMRKKIESIIIEFQEIHRSCDLSEKPLKIVGGVDETFF
jgi:hypothetical protein